MTADNPPQIEIPGIGQQKATLADWKVEHEVFTHKSEIPQNSNPWNAWMEFESAFEYMHKNNPDDMGFGKSEKDAILNLCDKHGITPPFWWKGEDS